MDSSERNNKKDGKTSKKSTIKVETSFFEVLTLRTIFLVNCGWNQAKFSHYVYLVFSVMFCIVLFKHRFIFHVQGPPGHKEGFIFSGGLGLSENKVVLEKNFFSKCEKYDILHFLHCFVVV